MILTSLLVNMLSDFKANFFTRNQFWKIDFMLNLYFQLANGLAQDFHVIHMARGPHEPLVQVHWSAGKANFRMKSIFKSFYLEKIWQQNKFAY